MTDRKPNSADDVDGVSPHDALLSLHHHARTFGDLDPGLMPGFAKLDVGDALRTLAGASEDEVSVSARLGVLGSLAAQDFPGYETEAAAYRALAASISGLRDRVDPSVLLDDLKLAAQDPQTQFWQTTSGQALPHHESVFVSEDVCTVKTVDAGGGLTATWVFSEFETDAPFDHVAEWIDPRNWPKRGPLLFKGMDIVGSPQPVDLGPPGNPHWHGIFRERVRLLKPVETLLHCDFWRDGDAAAGMTYDLALSVDREIDVDRGFLLVNDVGTVRRVKALKIVGFTNDIWDRFAEMVCPYWTDFVRAAAEGGSATTPTSPPPGSDAMTGSGSPLRDTFDAWADFLGDSARVYLDLFEDVTTRVGRDGFKTSACIEDERRLWDQLAQDWARAWAHGMDTLGEVSREGLDAGFTPPGTPRERGRGVASSMTGAMGKPTKPTPSASATTASATTATTTPAASGGLEGTVVPVAGLTPSTRPVAAPLRSIEAGGATIPASSLLVTVESLGNGQYGVRVSTSDPSIPSGLYVGDVLRPNGSSLVSVQLYVARATEA